MYKNKIKYLRSLPKIGQRFPRNFEFADDSFNASRTFNLPINPAPINTVPQNTFVPDSFNAQTSFPVFQEDFAPIGPARQVPTSDPVIVNNPVNRTFGNAIINNRVLGGPAPIPDSGPGGPVLRAGGGPTNPNFIVTPPPPPPNPVNVQELARQMANEMLAEQQRLQSVAKSGRIYSRFDRSNDVIEDQIETITSAVWSSGVAQLTTFFTSSNQTQSQKKYYVEVYDGNPASSSSLPQFSIAYGHAAGSGSDSAANMYDFASKTVYSQYKQLLLDSSATRFTTYGSGSTDSIYAIAFNRSRIKEKIDPGNFEFSLKNISSRATSGTGSIVFGSGLYTFIDDSSINTSPTRGAMGRTYNLVSGSLASGVYITGSSAVYYGTVYPEYGIIIVDGNRLDQNLSFSTNKNSNSDGSNHFAMLSAMSASALTASIVTSDPFGFYARNAERITSTHYFVRVKNSEYNFSNNPSFVTGSDGQIAQATFIGDPKTYITTVGLYNDRTELLAVAKLSKPLLKSFSREALIRVKLDF